MCSLLLVLNDRLGAAITKYLDNKNKLPEDANCISLKSLNDEHFVQMSSI